MIPSMENLATLPPFHQWFTLVFVVTQFIFWSLAGIFACVDWYMSTHNLWSKYKLQPKEVDWEKYRATAVYVVKRTIYTTLPMGLLVALVSVWRGNPNLSDPLPTATEAFFHFVAFLLVEEFMFYYCHRLMHLKRFYARTHKLHHEWTAPVAVSAIYATWVEHVFQNLLPIFMGPFLMKSHLVLAMAWFCIVIINTLCVHSGYSHPAFKAEGHDLHHKDFDVNYGVLGVLDWLHNTQSSQKKKT